LVGNLDFSTVDGILRDLGLDAFGNRRAVVLDLASVNRANSAGLVLLLEWRDYAAAKGVALSFANLPDSLLAIARLSNVAELLPQDSGSE
jgi:phospholipid transport system transporter-binding protein